MADSETPSMTLRVERAEPAADGIQTIELRHPEGAELPPFQAGAHILVRTPTGATRSYSLCNDPAERHRYVIAVKRDAAGRGGSVALVDATRPGDSLQVSAPRNQFALAADPAPVILIAGGIGITPILSMIHTLQAAGRGNFSLTYLTRNAPGTAFLAELAAHPWATIHHDDGDPDRAHDLWPLLETPTTAHVYCCGPRPLMEAVRDMTGHWPEHQLHFEDFGADLARPRDTDTPFGIRLARNGAAFDIPVGATILDTLRAHGIDAPSSCESGTCGTCRTRLLQGEADHRDLVLTEAERRTEIMICVSRAKTPLLVLDL